MGLDYAQFATERIEQMKWQRWDMGWGEDCNLAPGLEVTVYKSMSADEFIVKVFGRELKKKFSSEEEGKIAAEYVAKKWLNQAIKNLEEL